MIISSKDQLVGSKLELQCSNCYFLDEKEVSELPGVGKVAQNRLAELGFAKCYQVQILS